MSVEAILLSAGESSRMGKPKALLDWFGLPLINAQICSLIEGGADLVIVVSGAHHIDISRSVELVPNTVIVKNADWASGKTSSIKAGLSKLTPNCETIVLLAVDQPRPSWVVEHALISHRNSGKLVTSPRYSGHGGHPLFFDASLLQELSDISEECEGVREIMKRYDNEMNRVYFDNPIVRFDLNTPADYKAALTTYPSLAARP